MNIPLSNRLKLCCSFVQPGSRVADIGCDHGYLGITLLKSGTASSVIASDVKEGPLKSAMRNAAKFAVADKITFHLSDGVQNIPSNFDVMVCAGMGADTIISILNAAPWLKSSNYRLILQCQSRQPELRRYLSEQGYSIVREDLAKDGKFIYSVMEVAFQASAPLDFAECYISPALLHCGSRLLPDYYDRLIQGLRLTVQGLSHSNDPKLSHYQSILEELLKLEDRIHGNGS